MLTAKEWQEAVETWQMIAQRDADQLARSREILAICQERLRQAREREKDAAPSSIT